VVKQFENRVVDFEIVLHKIEVYPFVLIHVNGYELSGVGGVAHYLIGVQLREVEEGVQHD